MRTRGSACRGACPCSSGGGAPSAAPLSSASPKAVSVAAMKYTATGIIVVLPTISDAAEFE